MALWADRRAMTYLGCQRRLTRAGAISTVTLVCHRHTWAEVQALAGDRVADDALKVVVDQKAITDRGDGLLNVTLSGVQLAAIMHALRTAYFSNRTTGMVAYEWTVAPPRRALARSVYLAMARTVEQVSSTHTGTIPPIVIDDRTPGE